MTVSLYAMLMTFGALVAAAGLVLLFIRQEQGQNKIRILGQEFQISTPALVVFLAGCALVIMPPALQMKNPDVIVIPRHDGPNPDGKHVEHVEIDGEEKEPNDDPPHANSLTVGSGIKGVITTAQDRDFFILQSPTKPTAAPPRVRVIVRKLFHAQVVIYNENEEKVASNVALGEDTVSFAFEVIPGANYYVIVESFSDGHGAYELLFKGE